MKILALELSTGHGSLAWRDDDADRAAAAASAEGALVLEWANDRKNSGPFFENLKFVSEKFGSPDKIIVGLGPGSYAGVRIAISAAIGLQISGETGGACPEPAERVPSAGVMGRHEGRPSISAGIELIGCPSVCAMDCEAKDYCAIGDARRQSFFFARFCENNLIEGPTLFSETDLRQKLDKLEEKTLIFASEKLPQFERVTIGYPSAKVLARLAQEPNRHFEIPPLEPIYLREPHITLPRGIGIFADERNPG